MSTTINKLESDTFAGATIKAYKDQSREAGLVLRAPSTETDAGDFPARVWFSLRRFRRNISITQNHKRIVTHMARQLINTRNEKGAPTKTEYITFQGYYSGTTRKGEQYNADFEIGRYQRPKIIHNPNVRYDPKTGEPIGPEKTLSGLDTIYTIEVPKDKASRKKLIDSILGEDNYPDSVLYYYKGHDELARRDSSFSYSEFVDCSIDEMRKMSFRGGGSKAPGIWRDKDGKIRDKDGNLV